MTLVKICGLRRKEDIEAVNRLKPDMVGFMFYPGSKRYISYEQAAMLKGMLDPGIEAVGVFVNAREEEIIQAAKDGIIDQVQLHGQEDDAMIRTIQKATGLTVIKAFRMETEEDVEKANESMADLVLLDHGAGGSGKAFAWELANGMRRPYLLAGGLHAGNVKQAVSQLEPFGIDVSSGAETDGWKDERKIEAIIKAVRE